MTARKGRGKLSNLGAHKAAPFRTGGKRRAHVIPQQPKRANGAGKRGGRHK